MHKNQKQKTVKNKDIINDYFKLNKTVSNNVINLVIAAVFLALFLIARFVTKYADFLNNQSWQLQMAFFVLGLLFIKNFYYKILFFFIAPALMLAFGFSAEPFFGYLLPHYSFIFTLFIDILVKLINKKDSHNHKKNIFYYLTLTIIFSILSYFIIWISYSTQGYYWYKVTWAASFAYNSVVVFASMGLNIAVYLISIGPLYYMSKKIKY